MIIESSSFLKVFSPKPSEKVKLISMGSFSLVEK